VQLARAPGMSERKKPTLDEIRGLIEQVDGRLREAEQLRSHVNERNRRAPGWPDRRRAARVPTVEDGNAEFTRRRP
jgi:hypothetical protein